MSITINREHMQGLSDRAYELDIMLAAKNGPVVFSRTVVKNRLSREDNTDLSSLEAYFDSLPTTEKRIAVISRLQETIDKKFKEEFDTYFTNVLANQPTANSSVLSDEEYEVRKAERKSVSEQWNAFFQVWGIVNPTDDISDIKPPAKMTKFRGPQGPKPTDAFDFFVNGKEIPNSLSKLAKTQVNADGSKMTPRQLREFAVDQLKAKGVTLDWQNLPDVVDFILPDESSFKMIKKSVNDDDDDDAED